MIEFTILGSGSGGNAALVRCPEGVLLIDAGLSASQLCGRMEAMGVKPGDLSGILLTHEHGDHTRGLDVFCRKHSVPVLANAMTREVLKDAVKSPGAWKTIPCGGTFTFAGFSIETFRVPHDAVDPMGFVLRRPSASLGILSDLGHATSLVKAKVQELDSLFVEANYDAVMLANDTKRPWSTRQRIASRHGHLSNDQTAELLTETATARLNRVVLGHLSRDCNSPDAATGTVRAALGKSGCPSTQVSCATQDEPTPWFTVATPPPPPPPRPVTTAWQQAELF